MAEPFVLNRTLILDRLGGDEEIFVMMLDMYLQDIDSNCAALAGAQASGDALTLQREAHTVKGLLATFSDDAGAADAYLIEQKSRLGNVDGLDEAVLALQARLHEVAKVLAVELNSAR